MLTKKQTERVEKLFKTVIDANLQVNSFLLDTTDREELNKRELKAVVSISKSLGTIVGKLEMLESVSK